MHHYARCCSSRNLHEVNVNTEKEAVKRAVESVVYNECNELVVYSPKEIFYETSDISFEAADKGHYDVVKNLNFEKKIGANESPSKNVRLEKDAETSKSPISALENGVNEEKNQNIYSVNEQKKSRKEWRETILIKNVPI